MYYCLVVLIVSLMLSLFNFENLILPVQIDIQAILLKVHCDHGAFWDDSIVPR